MIGTKEGMAGSPKVDSDFNYGSKWQLKGPPVLSYIQRFQCRVVFH